MHLRRLGRGGFRYWVGNEGAVGDGTFLHGLFKQSAEQQSAETGPTPIEAKRKLVKITLQVI